jgi:hypothetical protein
MPCCHRQTARFACSFGRPPLNWNFVKPCSVTRHRADTCKTGLIEAARRAALYPTTRSTFRVSFWMNHLCTNRQRWCRKDRRSFARSFRLGHLPGLVQGSPHYPGANNTRNWLLRCAFGGFLGVCCGEAVGCDGVVSRRIAYLRRRQPPTPFAGCTSVFFCIFSPQHTEICLLTPSLSR